MLKNTNLELSVSDVKAILQEDYRHYQAHVAEYIFCGNCSRDHTSVGIKDYSITLNADNDIHLKGKCTLCNGDVGCYLEYGEVPLLFQRAEDLRKAYRNQGNMKVVKNE
jgi:hypothetical protein